MGYWEQTGVQNAEDRAHPLALRRERLETAGVILGGGALLVLMGWHVVALVMRIAG